MHPNTLKAINKLAAAHHLKIVTCDDNEVVLKGDEYGEGAEVHEIDGRWMVAHWSKLHSQWQSSDVKRPHQGFCYAFARTKAGLRDYGVTTYPSPTAALRSALTY